MARLNFSTVFNKLVTLFKAVMKKDTDDGASSAIKPYLAEQGIVLADDDTAVNDAVTAHTNFGTQEKLMEEKSEERDSLFNPAFVDHMSCVQFLKKLFRGNITKLGEWGVTVDERGRVVYPPDFIGRTAVVLALIAKHQSFAPGTSPLQPFLTENEIDLAANKTDVENSIISHTAFTTAAAAKEMFREQRDVLITPIEGHLRGIGQFLMGLYHELPKKAGQWGFEINDSPQGNRIRDGIVPAATSKVLRNLDVDEIFRNKGPVPLSIFPGDEASGQPTIVGAGQSFTIMRGFGTMTVVNESATTDGAYEGTFTK